MGMLESCTKGWLGMVPAPPPPIPHDSSPPRSIEADRLDMWVPVLLLELKGKRDQSSNYCLVKLIIIIIIIYCWLIVQSTAQGYLRAYLVKVKHGR